MASRVDERVGQVLGGRYRLHALIGTGASAAVYLADDTTLRRRVAVKVLHEALADDEAFLKRFRAEAQATAALNHPNLVAVYDWGSDEHVPYLVTEFLGGGSLRGILDAGRPLTPGQALLVGLEVARGLEYAHRRGLVHRDIKPANLLFDEDARLRIADFGLARALAEAAWTEPQGAVLGTARYASPEQAQGHTLDGRSDVYSLGLVLAEAVTGTVPFQADTTIGTLMARVGRTLPEDPALESLGPVVVAMCAPEPADRPDATAVIALLLDAAGGMDRPAPLPLAGTAVVRSDPDPTLPVDLGGAAAAAAVVRTPDDDITLMGDEAVPVVGARPALFDQETDHRDGATGAAPVAVRLADGPADPERRVDGPDGDPPRGRGRRAALLVLALVVLGGAAGAAWWFLIRVPTVPAPSWVGADVTVAREAASTNGWTLTETETRQDGTVAGQVVAQAPDPGTELAEGAAVAVTVSLGNTLVAVPADLAGIPVDEAAVRLADVGLVAVQVAELPDEEIERGIVLGVAEGTPAEVPKGGEVGLVISGGPPPRTVPGDLVGATQSAATASLRELGLVVSVTTQTSEDVPEGEVMEVRPAAGTEVAKGSTVTLVVSAGPPVVTVPDVAGLSTVEAADRLESAGLVVEGTDGPPNRPVTGTSPAGGTTVRRGTSVTLRTL